MNKMKYIFSLIILLMLSFKSFSKENVYIVFKINNEIITNTDIDKEYQYLVSLNNQLKNLDKDKISKISKESALREKIKLIELSKYFDMQSLDMDINNYLQNFYKNLGIKNNSEFEQYLKNNNIAIDYIQKKIQIEILWNQLIYDKYISQVNINQTKLKEKLKKIDNKKNKKMYFLSEILFDKENNSNFKKKLKKINESINELGFNNTANIYSISESSKFGGKVGWIEEQKLSKKIVGELKLLNIGQHTKPMQKGSSFLILKIDEVKFEENIFNEEEELKKLIQFETSKQLDQFSKIFYKKIKINNVINEL